LARQEDLAGAVKTKRVEKAKFTMEAGQWKEGPRLLREQTSYDAEGNELEHLQYDQGQRIAAKLVYKYDCNGRLTEVLRYDGGGRLTSRRVPSYNGLGRVAEEATYTAEGNLSGRRSFVYDEDGNTTEDISYDDSGAVTERLGFDYDDQNRVTEWRMYAGSEPSHLLGTKYTHLFKAEPIPPGALETKFVLSYDDSGRVAEATLVDAEGSVLESIFFTYEHGKSTSEQIFYNPDGIIAGKDRTVVEAVDSFGNESTVVKYRWDKEKDAFVPEEAIYTSYTYY
jgi:hypothetical protein